MRKRAKAFDEYFIALTQLYKNWRFSTHDELAPQKQTREVWKHAVQALRRYAEPSNWVQGRPREILPRDLAMNLATDLRWLLSGQMHPFLVALRKRGSPEPTIVLQNAMAAAVNYHRCCGRIVKDKMPIRTITKAYGIRARVRTSVAEELLSKG